VVLLSDFYDRVLEGNLAKELVKALLEKSGYLVIPYGYESTLSNLRKRLARRGTKKSRAVRKIRSSPDLLVYDGQRKDLMLVEIKMRKAPTETRVWLYKQRVAEYKEFWNESILVVLIPCGNIFYAQKISELRAKEEYDATTEFEKLEEIFTRVEAEDISHFRAKALQIMER
jgi:hypothetical protein